MYNITTKRTYLLPDQPGAYNIQPRPAIKDIWLTPSQYLKIATGRMIKTPNIPLKVGEKVRFVDQVSKRYMVKSLYALVADYSYWT